MRREEAVSALKNRFLERFGPFKEGDLLFSMAPGRVNLIGEHTDYNGGFVLPLTIPRAAYLLVRQRGDRRVSLWSEKFSEGVEWNLDDPPRKEGRRWFHYPLGVVEALRGRFPLGGFEGVVTGDVPLASGLSSSAALEVAFVGAVKGLFSLPLDPLEEIDAALRAEREYVGVQCGIMDQFVSRLGRSGEALFLDCRNAEYRAVPWRPEGISLLVVDTGAQRELAASAYNTRREECEEGVSFFQRHDPSIKSLRELSWELFQRYGGGLPEGVASRVRHVLEENRRVREAVNALERGDFQALGELFTASHRSLRDLYLVSSPELDRVVASSLEAGALGARLTGAGFGGCAIALFRESDLERGKMAIQRDFEESFHRLPLFLELRENFGSQVARV